MNAKLKSLLQRVWTEPRQFFFGLALVGVVGFLASGALSYHLGPNLPLALAARGSILGVLLAVPAFFLAWIPPMRRLLARLLTRRILVVACVAILVTLLYGVEDWRGWRAWHEFQRDGKAKGERFDPASFIPPPVPKDQNFFETPLWEDLRRAATNGATRWSGKDREDEGIFGLSGPNPWSGPPETGSWGRAQRVDLAAWQGYYRDESNRMFRATLGVASSISEQAFHRRYDRTNYFPTAKEPQTPAADVLLALGRFQAPRDLLIAAATRPQARFWLDYDEGTTAALPHLGRIRAAAQYLSLHASAALEAGRTEAALQDVTLIFRLLDSVRREPLLTSQLVRMGVLQLALQPVWEGLADRRWTAADLELIESELGKLDFVADYRLAVRGDLVCGLLWAVDYVQRTGIRAFDSSCSSGDLSASDELGRAFASAIFLLAPSGWYEQNKTSLARLTQDYLLPVCDAQASIFLPVVATNSASAVGSLRPRPYDELSALLLPAAARMGERFAYAQASVDLARIACALERYRLAHGGFPEALVALVPKFIEPLPHDVINGGSLKYRPTDDGQFILYSVGWNGKDDGGTVAFKFTRPDPEKGDWVWRYPPR